jgi:uncharacterized protein YneF (UPF0154 family)
MRLFDSIQGHFSLYVGRKLSTLAQGAEFEVVRVIPQNERQVGWVIELGVGKKKNASLIYITDILRVYTWVVSACWGNWVTTKEMEKFISDNCINKKQVSYMMALLATFDDIEHKTGKEASIRYIIREF